MPDPHINYDLQTKTIYTVATLPPVATVQGERYWVSDSTLAGFINRGTVVTGGGTTRCKVLSTGAVYKIDG